MHIVVVNGIELHNSFAGGKAPPILEPLKLC